MGFFTPQERFILIWFILTTMLAKKGFEDTNIWIILTSLQCGFKTLISLVY